MLITYFENMQSKYPNKVPPPALEQASLQIYFLKNQTNKQTKAWMVTEDFHQGLVGEQEV